MVEHASRAITDFLAERGLVAAFCVVIDTVFVAAAHAPAVLRWAATNGAALRLRDGVPLLSRRTSDCLDDRASRHRREREAQQAHLAAAPAY